jgi:hypothetical protein
MNKSLVKKIKKNIRRGMLIKLKDDLSKSIENFGGGTPKLKMQGKIKQVYDTMASHVIVEDDYGSRWSIDYSDIVELLDEKHNVLLSNGVDAFKPETFDLNNLVL